MKLQVDVDQPAPVKLPVDVNQPPPVKLQVDVDLPPPVKLQVEADPPAPVKLQVKADPPPPLKLPVTLQVDAPSMPVKSVAPSDGDKPKQMSRLEEMRRDGLLTKLGTEQRRAIAWALDEYPPNGDIPASLTPSDMAEKIQQWRMRKEKPRARLPEDALRRFCRRFLQDYHRKP